MALFNTNHRVLLFHVPFYLFASRDYVSELSFQSETAVDEFPETFRIELLGNCRYRS